GKVARGDRGAVVEAAFSIRSAAGYKWARRSAHADSRLDKGAVRAFPRFSPELVDPDQGRVERGPIAERGRRPERAGPRHLHVLAIEGRTGPRPAPVGGVVSATPPLTRIVRRSTKEIYSGRANWKKEKLRTASLFARRNAYFRSS